MPLTSERALREIISERDEEIIQLKEKLHAALFPNGDPSFVAQEKYGELMDLLTPYEQKFFLFLFSRFGRILSKQLIADAIYNSTIESDAINRLKVVDVYICKVRRAIIMTHTPLFIATHWGRGYSLHQYPDNPQELMILRILEAAHHFKFSHNTTRERMHTLLSGKRILIDKNALPTWNRLGPAIEKESGKKLMIEGVFLWLE